MQLIDDKNDPTLLGIIESNQDFSQIKKMVYNMNQDLRDSGFDQYKYKTVIRGDKIYVERKEA